VRSPIHFRPRTLCRYEACGQSASATTPEVRDSHIHAAFQLQVTHLQCNFVEADEALPYTFVPLPVEAFGKNWGALLLMSSLPS
jgi:hypothetical protein